MVIEKQQTHSGREVLKGVQLSERSRDMDLEISL